MEKISSDTKELKIYPPWCKGCGICVAFCPRNVLKLVCNKVYISDIDRCIGCAMCEKLCPDFAVYFLKTEGEQNGR